VSVEPPGDPLFAPRGRWLAVAATVVVLALVVVAGVLLFRDDDPDGGTFAAPSSSPSAPSESPPASPTPAPSESPSPSPSSTASPVPSRSPSPPRTPSPTSTVFAEVADGRPGWGRPEGGCYQATAPAGGAAPYPDLVIDLVLPPGPYRAGEPVNATLRVTNTGSEVRRFTSTDNSDDGVLIRGYARSAYYFTTVTTTVHWEVEPGVPQEYAVTIQTEQCGDTSTDPAPPLPPGDYQVVASMAWRDGGSGDVWVTPARSLTLGP
jgi:hypothetical protein